MLTHRRHRTSSIPRILYGMACASAALLSTQPPAKAEDPRKAEVQTEDIAAQRWDVMAARARAITFTASASDVPRALHEVPLFRYDDQTRGYVDGLVWKLGATGRPLAIITTELHPNYLGGGPRVVYDFLSLSEARFVGRSSDVNWQPGGAAVRMTPLAAAPDPAATAIGRLSQIKSQTRRFTATQHITETDPTLVQLRLLPKEIDRYQPSNNPRADGAAFLLVNGRNPGLILFIETDGAAWSYGVGRLSMPSTLTLLLDDAVVWSKPPGRESDASYTASNATARFP
ncbi:MAG: hypothetical protein SFV23_18140 [Planctomycetaceae bacterium]|nr:hypothetical protein [Planctomycetaceae bacterium]